MFELIVVFSALTAPVPAPVHRPVDVTALPAIAGALKSPDADQPAQASAATIASHSASSEPVAGARLARAYQ